MYSIYLKSSEFIQSGFDSSVLSGHSICHFLPKITNDITNKPTNKLIKGMTRYDYANMIYFFQTYLQFMEFDLQVLALFYVLGQYHLYI